MKRLLSLILILASIGFAQDITNKLGGDTSNETYDITDSNDNVLLRVQGDGGVKIGPTTNSGSLHVSGNVTAWSFATPGPIYDYWAESGTNGQILSSIMNGTAVDWVDAPSGGVDDDDGVAEVYGTGWDADGEAPTKNDAYDKISAMDGIISTNTSVISSNQTNITTNTSNISTNTSKISTNTSVISGNQSSITTNTADIATNAYNIRSNSIPKAVTDATWMTIDYFTWINSRYSGKTGGALVYEVSGISGTNLDIRVYDVTNSTVVVQDLGVSSDGFRIASTGFSNPTADARLAIQVKKSIAGGADPYIYGFQLEWDN